MKKTALLATILVTAFLVIAAYPVMANPSYAGRHAHQAYQPAHQAYQHSRYGYQHVRQAYQRSRQADRQVHRAYQPAGNLGTHSNITCDMVRSYVAQVGLQQAKAMATAAGMTPSEERRARQCLASRV